MNKEEEITNPDSCLNRAEEGEPVFVLRAKDYLAIQTVSYWILAAGELGLHSDRIEEARLWIHYAREWRLKNE